MSKTGDLLQPQHGGAHENQNIAESYQQHKTFVLNNVSELLNGGISCVQASLPHSSFSFPLPDAIASITNDGCAEETEIPTMEMEVGDHEGSSNAQTVPLSGYIVKSNDGNGQYIFQQNYGLNVVVSGTGGPPVQFMKTEADAVENSLNEGVTIKIDPSDSEEFQGHTISIPDRNPHLQIRGDTCNNIMDSAFYNSISSETESDLPESLQDFVFSSTLSNVSESSNGDNLMLPLHTLKSDTMNTGTFYDNQYHQSINSHQNVISLSNSESVVNTYNVSAPSSLNTQTHTTEKQILLAVQQGNNHNALDNYSVLHLPSHISDYSSGFSTKNENIDSFEDNNVFGSMPTSVQLPNSGSEMSTNASSHSLSDMNDNATPELNLTSLPNFLGLDSSSLHNDSHMILDEQHMDMLESPDPCNPLLDQKLDYSDTQELSTNLPNPDMNVTTISISNDQKNATKIMVNTNQGEPQMFLLNTTNLQSSNSISAVQNQPQQLYVVKASDLGKNTQFRQIDPQQRQMPTLAYMGNAGTNNTGTHIPGFILVPVVDNASNVIQPEDDNLSDDDPNSKNSDKKVIRCSVPGCMKAFKKASKLKVHQMLHTGERPYKCTLLGCEWAFTTPHKLKRHLESHEGRKDYACGHPGCGHKFTTIYNLNTHRKLHERPCTEPCKEDGCNLLFPTKRQLDLHMRNVHGYEDRTFECPHPGCEKVFFSSSTMGSHMRVHLMSEDDLRCKFPGCGKVFTRMCRLRQHEKLHTGDKPFVCDYEGCTWKFATASKLKRHQTKHTGLRQWVCSVCDKSFLRHEHLKGHLITHSGDRPFICPVEGCGNTFTAKSSLYVHLKKHDGEGKTIIYHCPMEECDRHYSSKSTLRQHILQKHCQNTPNPEEPPELQAPQPPHGVVSWLSLLEAGGALEHMEAGGALEHMGADAFEHSQDIDPPVMRVSQDTVMATDFLTGSIPPQAVIDPSNGTIQLHYAPTYTSAGVVGVEDLGQQPQMDQPHIEHYHHIEPHQQVVQAPQQHMQHQMFETQTVLQQQEDLLAEASKAADQAQPRGQIMLENLLGSARTDPNSNDIISQKVLKRWQIQKEQEAASLGAQLNAHSQGLTVVSVAAPTVGSCHSYTDAVSNNVPLAASMSHSIQVARLGANGVEGLVKVEIPDMELQAEGLSESALDGRTPVSDAFMSQLFVRDPETGITYRQTQLLQDDPPNPDILEEMEGVAPTHNMGLDAGLDVHFDTGTLAFQELDSC